MSNSKSKGAEEDLDDLDDVLDQFTIPASLSQSKFTAHSPPSSESGPSGSRPQTESGLNSTDEEAAFREAWYKMIIQDLEAEAKGKGLDAFLRQGDKPEEDIPTKGQTKPSEVEEGQKTTLEDDDPFQKAIRQAMEKLQDSDNTLKTESGEDDLDENLESILGTMMSQLMSKDILYEPLKELDTKYPDYLAENGSSLPKEDLSRFTDQKTRVSQIIAIFEDPAYSDDNEAQSAEILRLMNEMQSYGSPPAQIMGPVPPGFELGEDGMPKVPDGCIVL